LTAQVEQVRSRKRLRRNVEFECRLFHQAPQRWRCTSQSAAPHRAWNRVGPILFLHERVDLEAISVGGNVGACQIPSQLEIRS
jgi:hypothetical protein